MINEHALSNSLLVKYILEQIKLYNYLYSKMIISYSLEVFFIFTCITYILLVRYLFFINN